MTVTELVNSVREDLRAAADPAFKAGVERFFREPVDALGVRSSHVQRIAAAAARAMKTWPADDRRRFAEALWKDGKIEQGMVVTHAFRRFVPSFGPEEFGLFESWIDRHITNWANCDGVASWLLAGAIANRPELVGRLTAWAASPNRWKRRAAIVSLLQEAKRGRHTAEILAIADAVLEDDDDMVRKGLGWVLKEAYPKRPREVMAFLTARRERAPRLVLRLAAEKMTASDRARTLSRRTR